MKRLLATLALAAVTVMPAAWLHARLAAAASPAFIDACAVTPRAHFMRCFAILHVVSQPPATSPDFPSGYHPSDLRSAYKLPSTTAGSGQTVAIVDAFDDPMAESDLAVYRKQFGLPPCTAQNGCFKKVNGNGQPAPLPQPNPVGNWQVEESLDLDMVSAICPNCHILLVEASSNWDVPLGTAVGSAARLGANAISNSYGEPENQANQNGVLLAFYKHPGTAVTASSGDSGYSAGPQFPADAPWVTAVGGTTLNRAPGTPRGWSESAWSGAGSGCSTLGGKPPWQKDPLCKMRTIADVAAIADPGTGVAFYDTFNGAGGWGVVGGTSVASPIIASVYALAGNAAHVVYGSYPYSHTSSLYDITSGSNGSCGGTYLCTATKGYDGPTGNGTPDGTGAF